ncbi:MAG: Imidazole glycerol phosphate synthase subunit HisH [Acidimicrobiales bacterium AG-410-I20]|nr:MAG: Imidazole glycerol phosphate synthase subunit HisH [Acidimicrobiales bacterium AG-410-I20]
MTNAPVIAVLDYGIGNLRSAQKAFEHVGAKAFLTNQEDLILNADAIVLPGVGSFGRCITALQDSGLEEITKAAALDASRGGRPFLGICVGLQMLFSGSEETPGLNGLGIFEGKVSLLSDAEKLPQMQWNSLSSKGHMMFHDTREDPWVYFVHSYAAPIASTTVATCTYGQEVCAAVAEKNLWATQFHPEKSGETGLQILRNFLHLAEGGI